MFSRNDDPARIKIDHTIPMRVKRKKYTYIQPLEQGGGVEVLYEELYCAAKHKKPLAEKAPRL
jgi:hypothetical protein